MRPNTRFTATDRAIVLAEALEELHLDVLVESLYFEDLWSTWKVDLSEDERSMWLHATWIVKERKGLLI